MMGRKSTGPRLVRHLDGSEQAKDRLEVMLESLFGLPIEEACQRLGIGEAMLHRLRTRALQGALATLEPRRRGRRRQELSPAEEACQSLAAQVTELQAELKISELRRELESILPHVIQDRAAEDEARKKNHRRQRRRNRKRRPR
jgi:hypothetical protein